MATASTDKRTIEVTLLRPARVGAETFTLPEGATLADLLCREAGATYGQSNLLIDGRPLEDSHRPEIRDG